MKESYRKGVANHPDPRTMRGRRATTHLKRWEGAYAGGVSRRCELRNRAIRAPTASSCTEGHTEACVSASTQWARRSRRPPACIETSRTRTERPRCRPWSVGHGPLGESEEL